MSWAHLTPENRKRISALGNAALLAKYGPGYHPTCAQCGAPRSYTSGRLCGVCYRGNAARKRAEAAALMATPEWQAQQHEREQRKWLREGKKTLKQVRQILKAPSLSPLPAAESSQGKTSP